MKGKTKGFNWNLFISVVCLAMYCVLYKISAYVTNPDMDILGLANVCLGISVYGWFAWYRTIWKEDDKEENED